MAGRNKAKAGARPLSIPDRTIRGHGQIVARHSPAAGTAGAVTPVLQEARQAQALNIENITVQVQRLESDQDYEEMAERVSEQIMEKVTRGMAVGGVRIG